MTAVEAVAVVVPARDEVERLPTALAALQASAAALPAELAVPVRVLVVLDRCRDGSAAAVAAAARRPTGPASVEALEVSLGSAGAARRAGAAVAVAAALARGVHPAGLWLASTDADSRVPPAWLAVQLRAARGGAGLVLGTAVPDPDELPAGLRAAWAQGYRAVEGHGHVHGANLGVRASAYAAAGGWPPVAAHEDVALARAVAATGTRVVRTAEAPVTTSARRTGRAPDGFAAHLSALERRAPSCAEHAG